MKRQLIAIALGSLLALPALAERGPNYELYANGFPPPAQPSAKSRAQVHAELIAAQRAGLWVANAELGTLQRPPVMLARKTRDQVVAELIRAQRNGNFVLNAELGLTGRQMYPDMYAAESRDDLRATLGESDK